MIDIDIQFEDLLFASQCRDPDVSMCIGAAYRIPGFVYVIAPEGVSDVVKIGWADSLVLRLAGLQIGSWEQLRVAAAVAVMKGRPIRLEQAVHKEAKKRGYHRRGEWFNLCEVEAVNLVVQTGRKLGIEMGSVAEFIARDRLAITEAAIRRREEDRAILRRKLGMD